MKSLLKRFFLSIIKGYRRYLSPLFPPRCRYIPTCSTYALEAIEKYGPYRGGLLALKRLLRCNPFGSCGYDPVPPPEQVYGKHKRK